MDRTLTPYQMQLLSDIFRIICKEIRTDEDKEKLAPGEIGISYIEGCFYIKNPYTGELFSPNSIEHIQKILSKYDPYTNLLNADRISGIRFYSSLSQLEQLGIEMTADTIIRQMEYPSILMAGINYENYQVMGFPGERGIMIVHKIDPETVMASFYDYRTYTSYDGKYNPVTHYLEGWSASGGSADSEYTESEGGGDSTIVKVDKEIQDLSVITVRITETLNPGATITVNDLPPMPFLNADGTPYEGILAANNIIMLVYDKARSGWMIVRSTESTISALIDMVNSRLSSTIDSLNHHIQDTTAKFKEVYSYINTELAKPGTIVTKTSTFTPEFSTDTVNTIADFVYGVDKLIINYNQTILREEIDYIVEKTGGVVFTFSVPAGSTVQFIVIKQVSR